MNPRVAWLLAVTGVQSVALGASAWIPDLGGPSWHQLASLAAVLAPIPFLWKPLLHSRTFLGLGVFISTLLALASGFVILYSKPWLKAHVLVDWIKFWHVLWSWAGIVFFVFHTWINRVAYAHFWNQMHQRVWPALLHHGGILLVFVAIPLTWNDWGRGALGDDTYILSTLYLWVLVVGPSYALWLATLGGAKWAGLAGFTTHLARANIRPAVDLALVPVTVLANVSGFPITFWKDQVHENGFKFIGKMWHTAPSILMAVLIFAHTVHLWGPMVRHWERFSAGTRARGA